MKRPCTVPPFMRFVSAFALVLLLLATGVLLYRKSEEPAKTRVQWPVMGTIAGLTFRGSCPEQDVIRARVQGLYARLETLLSAWNPDSEISRMARLAGTGVPVAVSPEVTSFYADAFKLARLSEGAFNPLVGPAMRLWGFNGGTKPSVPPRADTLAALPFHWTETIWSNGTIRLPHSGMSLDLGALAKGEAVDRAFEKIRTDWPDRDVLIDLGGNLRVAGTGVWRTGVRNPFGPGFAAVITLTNGEAVATSGNYERFVSFNGVRYAHILDGRTGRPVTGTASVTVIAPTAARADGLSTTLFILGPTAGQAFLHRFFPDTPVLWIPDAPDAGPSSFILTPAMRRRAVIDRTCD